MLFPFLYLLGFAAWQADDKSNAKKYFAKAIKERSGNLGYIILDPNTPIRDIELLDFLRMEFKKTIQ